MNLNNLKPAWNHFKVTQAMAEINADEVMRAITTHHQSPRFILERVLKYASLYSFLIVFCQGC